MTRRSAPYTVPVYRLQLKEDGCINALPIRGPADIARQCSDLASADREQIQCLFLNTKNRPSGRQVISVGTLNETLLHPREVFKAAILSNACGIVLVHNHPSGDHTPSRDDDAVTRTVAKAGALLNIRLLDHVIVTPGGDYYSYKENRPALLAIEGSSWPEAH